MGAEGKLAGVGAASQAPPALPGPPLAQTGLPQCMPGDKAVDCLREEGMQVELTVGVHQRLACLLGRLTRCSCST